MSEINEIRRQNVLGFTFVLLYQAFYSLPPPEDSQTRRIALSTLLATSIVLAILADRFPRLKQNVYLIHEAPCVSVCIIFLLRVVFSFHPFSNLRSAASWGAALLGPPLVWVQTSRIEDNFSRHAWEIFITCSAAIHTTSQYIHPSHIPGTLPPWTALASSLVCVCLGPASFQIEALTRFYHQTSQARKFDLLFLNSLRFMLVARIIFGIIFKDARDTLIVRLLQTSFVVFFEYLIDGPRLPFGGQLVFTELAIAACWASLAVRVDVNSPHSFFKLALLYGFSELVTSFVITIGNIESIFGKGAARLNNEARNASAFDTLTWLFLPRLHHFCAAQLALHVFYTLSDSHVNPSQMTRLIAFIIGILHITVPSHGVTRGAGSAAAASLRATLPIRMGSPMAHVYERGVLSVATLETMLRVLQSLPSDISESRLREIDEDLQRIVLEEPSFANTVDLINEPHRYPEGAKVAALSYKHEPPYEGRKVKISRADLSAVKNYLQERSFTHVWCDFAENLRKPNCGAQNQILNEPADFRRGEASWFEEGVAPYCVYPVIAVWDPTTESSRTSMWIRLEELSGLLGGGIHYLSNSGDARVVEGLKLPFKQVVIQLGARAGMGELSGCRESYNDAVDYIHRFYGRLMASVHLIGGRELRENIADAHDEVYQSQLCVNALLKIPERALKPNRVSCRRPGAKIEMPIGRKWGRENRGEENQATSVMKRFPGVRLFRGTSNESCRRRGDGRYEVMLIVEVMSADGAVFRSEFGASVLPNFNSNDDYGRDVDVAIESNMWLGEKPIDEEHLVEVHGELKRRLLGV